MRFATTRMTSAALMTALTAVSAYLVIPIGPVPVTMQSSVVLASGALLGSRWGGLSQTIYVIMGLIGVPVFAGGRSGPGVVLSPTFGYLIGFIAAAMVTGWWIEQRSSPTVTQIIIAMLAGSVALDICGLAYLYFNLNVIIGQATSWGGILSIGFFPFLPFDMIKAALALSVVMAIKKRFTPSQTGTFHPSSRQTIP